MKMVLDNILLTNANSTPKKLAVIDKGTGTVCTYAELNAKVNRFAHALTDLGVSKGDRVAIVQHNCLEYLVAIFAAFKIGAVLAAFDYRAAPREVMYLLNDSRANTLIIGENYLHLISPVNSEISTVRNVICIGQGVENMQSYNELISMYPAIEPVAKIDENDMATLYYTSGTTGRPKGVMMTHGNLVTAMMNTLKALPVTSEDITLHTSPFSHIAPIWPLLDHCYVGGGNVILRGGEPRVVLDAISEHRVTTWNTVPTVIRRLIEYPEIERYDLSSLRWIGYGASPMPIEVLKKAILKLGNKFTQVYGATETYIVTVLPKEDHVLDGPEEKLLRLRSCGKPLDGFEVRIINGHGKEAAPGEAGEIIVKGDSVTRGYWELPEETAKEIKEGWYYTGDLATVDEEGYIYIVDRKKEIIISGGENISPREVEEVIYRHPSVFEATVIGVPDEKWVEAVKAVVVLKEGEIATEDEIIAFCKQYIASYKAPKSVDFSDSLPKTVSGKIARKEIKEKYRVRGIMEKETFCPWCGKKIIPKMSVLKQKSGKVRERRCAACDKVLAAYLLDEGNFMSRIRKFENP